MHMGAHAPGMRGAGPDPEGVHAAFAALQHAWVFQHCNAHEYMHVYIYVMYMHACICFDMNMLTLRMACMQLPSPPGSSRRSFV